MLLAFGILLILVNSKDIFGQPEVICPERCQCTGLSALCIGDNNTFLDVVGTLSTDIQNFTFILSTRNRSSTISIDSERCGLMDRLNNLERLQIQPESQDQSYKYCLRLTEVCETFLCSLKRLKYLHLNVEMKDLSTSTIQCLRRLELLDLSYARYLGQIAFDIMSANLSRNLETLLLRFFQPFLHGTQEFNFLIFNKMYRNSLENLDLAENTFTSLSPGVLLLPRLRKLDLSGNLLFYLSSFNRLTGLEIFVHPNLQEVRATDQGITPIPGSVNEYGGKTMDAGKNYPSLYASFKGPDVPSKHALLTVLAFVGASNFLSQNTDTAIKSGCLYSLTFPIGKNLRSIDLSGFLSNDANKHENPVPRGRFCFDPNNNVQSVDLSHNDFSGFLDRPTISNFTISGLNKVRWINLEKSNWAFPLQTLFFSEFPSLCTLLLGGNQIQLHWSDGDVLPRTLGTLRTLDLSANQLQHIPYYEFSKISLETLNLSRNLLRELNFTLPRCGSLRMLNISSNKLSSLNGTMTRQMDAYGPLEVDLRSNEFVCGCYTLDFVYWVRNTHVTLTGKENLSCFTDLGLVPIRNINFYRLYKKCNPLTTVQIALITASTTVCCLCLILLTRHLHRRRWRIRYFWYRRRLQRMRAERRMEDNYEYDAFISCSRECVETRVWLQTHLERELEERRGLRLFIPERDMDYGRCLLRDIGDKMETCRKAILVLSPEYLTSWECLYEAWSVHATMVAEDRDAAILVRMQALPIAGIPGTLTRLMEMRECFTWTEDPEGQELFWERLYDALVSAPGNPVNE